MHITIAQRLYPFSHEPGICCLLPKTSWQVQVFPTLLRFKNIGNPLGKAWELPLKLKGPVKNFTVCQDLEKCQITVFGHTLEGYVRYHLRRELEGVVLDFEKAPSFFIAQERQLLPLACDLPFENTFQERLSLGCHKSQDWMLVKRRSDMSEIFPFWLRLSQVIPRPAFSIFEPRGLFSLLDACRQAVVLLDKNVVASLFTDFFHAVFQGILSPQTKDEKFLGLVDDVEISCSPLVLLHESADLIRSLFIQENEESLSLLPCLPTEFHAGRMTQLQLQNGDRIEIEWSKKLLKKVIWHPARDRIYRLKLQRSLKSFRMRNCLKERGTRVLSEQSLELHAGKVLYLDRFEK